MVTRAAPRGRALRPPDPRERRSVTPQMSDGARGADPERRRLAVRSHPGNPSLGGTPAGRGSTAPQGRHDPGAGARARGGLELPLSRSPVTAPAPQRRRCAACPPHPAHAAACHGLPEDGRRLIHHAAVSTRDADTATGFCNARPHRRTPSSGTGVSDLDNDGLRLGCHDTHASPMLSGRRPRSSCGVPFATRPRRAGVLADVTPLRPRARRASRRPAESPRGRRSRSARTLARLVHGPGRP